VRRELRTVWAQPAVAGAPRFRAAGPVEPVHAAFLRYSGQRLD